MTNENAANPENSTRIDFLYLSEPDMVEAGVRHALGAPGAVVLLRMLPTSSRPIEERERTEGVINTRTIPIP